jgi:hypothetical protein
MTCFSNEYLLSVFYVVGEVRTSDRGPPHSSRAAQAEAALGDLNIDLDLERKIPRRIDELHPRTHEQEFLVPLR